MTHVKLFSVSSMLLRGSHPARSSALARGKRAVRRACPATSPVINCHIMLQAASYPAPSAAFIYYRLHVKLCSSIYWSPW